MNPAYSVILFTTFSGAGYGLLIFMALFAFADGIPIDRWFGAVSFLFAFGMILFGLFASTFHLGHPERIWLAFSQWRTSWLSREAVLSVGTLIPAALFAFSWVAFGEVDGAWRMMAGITMMLSVMTVYCTAMIYASLRTIREWFNPHTIRVFLAFSIWTGSVWFNFLAHLFGLHSPWVGVPVAIAGLLVLFFKRKYWMFIDRHPAWVTPESGTGLGELGNVRQLDAPNTQENYVQKEMGYQIARKHVYKIRRNAFMAYFLFPFLITLITMESERWMATTAALISVMVMMAGTMAERWLFFAEAKHPVSVYSGSSGS